MNATLQINATFAHDAARWSTQPYTIVHIVFYQTHTIIGVMDTFSDMFARGTQRLIHDSDYVAYVFKKTEKICNAVYFITAQSDNMPYGHTASHADIVREVEGSALALLGHVQATLSRTSDELPIIASTLSIAILDLQAKLGMLASTGRMSRDHLAVFTEELDTLERAIYFHEPDRGNSVRIAARIPKTLSRREQSAPVATPKASTPSPKPAPQTAQTVIPHEKDTSPRTGAIRDILARSPSVSVKDIARFFPDVSEKTIQRDVNTLIERGVVRKEGEKRWSRYSLVTA